MKQNLTQHSNFCHAASIMNRSTYLGLLRDKLPTNNYHFNFIRQNPAGNHRSTELNHNSLNRVIVHFTGRNVTKELERILLVKLPYNICNSQWSILSCLRISNWNWLDTEIFSIFTRICVLNFNSCNFNTLN